MALFGGAVDPRAYLYHYTSADRVLDLILPTSRLRIGPLRTTNDPRESQQWLVSLTASSDVPADDEFFRIIRETDEIIKATTKVACFTMDDEAAMRDPAEEQFARGWAHSRMWAQYADNHRGVCLIFDRPRITTAMDSLRSLGDLWEGPVHYANQPRSALGAGTLAYDEIRRRGLRTVVHEHVRTHTHRLFFLKNRDWANEIEYRWVLRDGAPDPGYVDIAGTVAGIVVGPDFPAAEVGRLRAGGATVGLDSDLIARLHWRNGYPSPLPNPEATRPRV